MISPRCLSLALCKAYDPDAEILPGVVAGPVDLWPVPQLYNALYDLMEGDASEHNWADVDVQIAPGVSAVEAAAYLRRVAAWLDKHGAELLAHPHVVDALGSGAPSSRHHIPREHLRARDNLRRAIEKRIPTRKRKP